MPFTGLPPLKPSSKPCLDTGTGMCGSSGLANKFCANPVHKILYRGIHHSKWQCESCVRYGTPPGIEEVKVVS
jgi:hypothetical protein